MASLVVYRFIRIFDYTVVLENQHVRGHNYKRKLIIFTTKNNQTIHWLLLGAYCISEALVA